MEMEYKFWHTYDTESPESVTTHPHQTQTHTYSTHTHCITLFTSSHFTLSHSHNFLFPVPRKSINCNFIILYAPRRTRMLYE